MNLQVDQYASVHGDEELERNDASRYSLGVSACSPPPQILVAQYNSFVSAVLQKLPGSMTKNLYIYPTSSLHITIATLHGFSRKAPADGGRELVTVWRHILERELQKLLSFTLIADSLEIRGSAAILRMKDVNGGISKMRQILGAKICEKQTHKDLSEAGSHPDYFRVPLICHMSLLRFRDIPPSVLLQKRMIHLLQSMFKDTWQPVAVRVKNVTLRESLSFHAITGWSIQDFELHSSKN